VAWRPRVATVAAATAFRRDARVRAVQISPFFQGMRLLRQDPLECIFSVSARSTARIAQASFLSSPVVLGERSALAHACARVCLY
jgi:hypothetical protein